MIESETLDQASSKRLTLRRNFSWTFVGNVLFGISTWLLLAVLAKLGNARMVGMYALAIAVTQPIVMFAQLQLRLVQATDTKEQYKFFDYLSLRLICLSAAIVVMTVVASMHKFHTTRIIMIIGIGACFDAISDVIYGLMQQRERMDKISISMSIKGPLQLALLAIGLVITHKLIFAVSGIVAASLAVLFFYDIPNAQRFLGHPGRKISLSFWKSIFAGSTGWRFDRDTAKLLAILALPLGITTLLTALFTNVPRYLVDGCLGHRQLGIFAAMVALIGPPRVLINALGQAATTRMAQYYAVPGDARFMQLLMKLTGIAVVMAPIIPVIAGFCGPRLLTTIYTAEYAQHLDAFIWILVAGGISYIGAALGFAMSAARAFKVQILYTGSILATCAVTCGLFIPKMGLLGAGISAVITSLVQLVVGIAIILKLIHIRNSRVHEVPAVAPESDRAQATAARQ